MTLDTTPSNHRWWVLSLAVIINIFVYAGATLCMPVLFAEISKELGLNLVEVGTVWASIYMAGILIMLFAGMFGDRFGAKRMITFACLLAGVFGSFRGLATGFLTLAATSFLFGLTIEVIPVNATKIISQWFQDKRAGMAQSVLTSGVGAGSIMASMLSATVFSPLLGGWRNVIFLYGAISIIVGIVWLITVRQPDHRDAAPVVAVPGLGQSISQVAHIRAVWFLGITMLGFAGCYQSTLGYLPLYLRNIGWAPTSADGALTALNAAGTMFAVPILLLSDRLGKRKMLFIIGLAVEVVCTGLLKTVTGPPIWLLVIILGVMRDASFALAAVLTIETKGIGPQYAGTAVGLVFAFSRVGIAVCPPLGNSLAAFSPGMPFLLWSGFAMVALVSLLFVGETGRKPAAGVPEPPTRGL
jgi:cyanate permease